MCHPPRRSHSKVKAVAHTKMWFAQRAVLPIRRWANRWRDIAHVVGGDELVALVHLGRPPVAHPLQEASEAFVDVAVAAQHKAHPVAAAQLEFAALAGAAASLLHRLCEPFRPRWAELDGQHPLHRPTLTNPG